MLRRMKAALVGLALILGLGCAAAPPAPAQTSRERLAGYVINATVALVDEEGRVHCTGAMVDNGLALTAAHCVRDRDGLHEDSALVGFREDQRADRTFRNAYRFRVVSANDAQDIAVLQPPARLPPHGTLSVAVAAPHVGAPVMAVGHPLGLTYTVTTGIVSNPSRHDCQDIFCELLGGEKQHWMQISAPLYFGNSGGPIVNRNGQLVGIASFLASTPHLSGVVHVDEIRRALAHPSRVRTGG